MRTFSPVELTREGRLGQGAEGEVVAVRHTATGARFALKHSGNAADREAILLGRLRHPNILPLEGMGRDSAGAFFLTPVADGDLTAALQHADRDLGGVLADLLRGLAFLHARGYVHGDLKPSNVLVVEGRACLADLGLARAAGEGETGGTPAYMAPERLRGAPATPSSDLYALGATIVMALGAPIPSNPAIGAAELVRWLSAQHDPGLATIAPLLRVLLETDPARRPANARHAARRLAQLTGNAGHAQETEATARAWLRPTALARRTESLEALRSAIREPGVVALRAAPAAGGSRLLEELALTQGGVLADVRTGALPDGGLVLVDDADLADDRIQARLVELHRRALEGEHATKVVALVRPGGALDRRLAAESVRSVDLPPLDVEALAALVEQVFPDRGDPRPFAARLHEVTGGAPGRAVALLASLAAQGTILPGVFVDADVPGPEVLDGVDAATLPAALRDPIERLFAAEPAARSVASLLVAARRPLSEEMLRRALATLAPGAELAPLVAQLRDLRAVSDRALVLDGEQTRALVEEIVGQDPAARAALAAALAPGARTDADDGALLAFADVARLRGDPQARSTAARALFGRSLAWEAAALLREGDPSPGDRLLLARCLAQLGELDGAVAEARRAAAEGAEGAALFGAEIHVRKGDYAAAARELEAATAAGAYGDDLDALLARSLALTGQHERAGAICKAAIDAGASGPAAVDLVNTSALSAYFKGDLDEAQRRYEDAVARAREIQDKAREGNATNGLGLVAQRQGRFDDARTRYAEALALAESAGDRMRVGGCHMNLGTVLQELGRTREAAQQYRRSAAVQRLCGERVQSARARSNLANLLLYVGRIDEARAAAEEARVIAEAAGAGVVRAFAVMLVGEGALVAGNATEAAVRLTEARDLFDRIGSVSEAIEAETLLARLAIQQGDLAGAGGLARELASKARARGLDLHEAKALLAFADAQPEGASEIALAAAHRALGLAQPSKRVDLLWRIEAAIARRSPDDEGRRFHATRANATLEEAAAKVDPEDREGFVNRPDRARVRGFVAGLAREASLASKGVASRLQRLLSINRRLGRERNLRSLLEEIVDQAVELCGAERGFVLLSPDRPGGPLNVMVARNIDGESLAKGQLKVSHSIAERVLTEGEPVLTLDAQQDERYQQQLSVAALKLRSVLCVPLRHQGATLGALYLDNRFRARAFGDEDLELLEAFADQASIALAQVRALEEARALREAAERARAEIEELNAKLAQKLEAQEVEIIRARREADEQRLAAVARSNIGDMVGDSAVMQRLLKQVERVAATDLTVLVTGESGTGKELVAKALFAHGTRRKKPFVSVNCGAFNEGVLESELFGHVRGAFTGADRDREGLFQVADGGTLFLDEVGEMSPAMQVKLLRALQEGEVRKVGGKDSVRVDVRVIAATNRDLAKAIRDGRFREDLYYRLNVVTLQLPPLRDRLDDLPALCARLLSELPPREGRGYRLTQEALGMLARYRWPGNIRELRATLHNAALFAETEVITVADFANKPELTRPAAPARVEAAPIAGRSIEEIEAEAIRRTLELTKGNKSETARLLGIDRKTLYNKMSRLGLGAR